MPTFAVAQLYPMEKSSTITLRPKRRVQMLRVSRAAMGRLVAQVLHIFWQICLQPDQSKSITSNRDNPDRTNPDRIEKIWEGLMRIGQRDDAWWILMAPYGSIWFHLIHTFPYFLHMSTPVRHRLVKCGKTWTSNVLEKTRTKLTSVNLSNIFQPSPTH